ncbi:hypothetical protein OSB04_015495 [Centaurea solstitialis]|uniref:F-box domain-containing protein n=1 Tax=Centaurea solstitialis TaxID=347529 RepID=A0AA38WGL7_9ASTR|nr:hypothetical protein OSB04_015495 [Centaurea solstitialis]
MVVAGKVVEEDGGGWKSHRRRWWCPEKASEKMVVVAGKIFNQNVSENVDPMLPLDIQFLIIERLPIKSLLRFRSVCKPWKSFISSSALLLSTMLTPNNI